MVKTGKKSIRLNMALSGLKELMSVIIPIVTTMYIVRTIGKDNYGEIQYVRSILNYFSLLAGLGISVYAVREGAAIRNDRIVFQKFSNEMLTINIISAGISLSALYVFLYIFYTKELLLDYRLYLIFSLPIIINTLGREWINTVYEDYVYITIRYILVSFIMLACMFLFIHNENDYILYAIILALYSGSTGFLNIFYVRRYSKLGLTHIKECKRHIKSILTLFSSSIATIIYLNSDVTIIGALIGNEAVAIYSVAANIYLAVKQVSNSVVAVIVPRVSFYLGNDKTDLANTLIKKIIECGTILLIPTVLGLIILRNEALLFIGGEEYSEGGFTLLILSLSLFFAVFANIMSRCVLIPHKEDKVFLIATIVSALVNISLNFVFIPLLSYVGAAITTLLSEAIVFCIMLVRSRRFVSLKLELKSLIRILIACIPMAFFCFTIRRLSSIPVIVLLISSLGGALIYTIFLFLMNDPIIHEAYRSVSKIISNYSNRT